VIWRNVIKGFIRALTPIVIIPVCLFLNFLDIWFNYLLSFTNSYYSANYLIWSQVEVALRQSKLNEMGYEPVFIAYIEEKYHIYC